MLHQPSPPMDIISSIVFYFSAPPPFMCLCPPLGHFSAPPRLQCSCVSFVPPICMFRSPLFVNLIRPPQVSGTLGHQDTGTLGHWDTRSPVHWDTSTMSGVGLPTYLFGDLTVDDLMYTCGRPNWMSQWSQIHLVVQWPYNHIRLLLSIDYKFVNKSIKSSLSNQRYKPHSVRWGLSYQDDQIQLHAIRYLEQSQTKSKQI